MNIHFKNIYCILPCAKTCGTGRSYEVKETNIYVTNDIISGIGTAPDGFIADRTVQGKNKILSVGLVNAHNHAYMSVFRNSADDVLFEEWLFKRILPLEDKLVDEDIYWGTQLSCLEMLKSGTTTFLDMHITKNIVPKAVEDVGMRAVISKGIVGEGTAEYGLTRLADAKEEINNFKNSKLVSFMLAPHAIYTCDSEYLKIVTEEAKKLNVPIHTHLAESPVELKDALEKYGKTPVEYLADLGVFDVKTICAHCVQLNDNDIDIFKKYNVSVAANPVSNLKLANGIAPIKKMLDKGINVAIGTDGPASNNGQNMFREMNFHALLHKGVNHDAEAVSALETYKCATENGAKALALDNCGVLEVGKKADLFVMDINQPQFYPRNNLMSALCYSARGTEIDMVLVDGKILIEDGKSTTLDEEKIYYNASKVIERITK
ncbi:MAG: amidohydrolase [Clostridiales bacterium]|nr:amidohydrolase [Clostridiales bacterium]